MGFRDEAQARFAKKKRTTEKYAWISSKSISVSAIPLPKFLQKSKYRRSLLVLVVLALSQSSHDLLNSRRRFQYAKRTKTTFAARTLSELANVKGNKTIHGLGLRFVIGTEFNVLFEISTHKKRRQAALGAKKNNFYGYVPAWKYLESRAKSKHDVWLDA